MTLSPRIDMWSSVYPSKSAAKRAKIASLD